MNPHKDLGRTKMREGPRKHLCPSQIFGAFFRRFRGSMREVLDRGNLSPKRRGRRHTIAGKPFGSFQSDTKLNSKLSQSVESG